MSKVLDLVVSGSAKDLNAALKELLKKSYLGDEDAYRVLLRLYDLYILSQYRFTFTALYGDERYWGEIFEIIGTLPVHERLISLAEMYRHDRTVYDDLLDALVDFKRRLILEGAPSFLVNAVNAILSELGKPEDVYRDVKHLYAMYLTWKEMGDRFDESSVSISPRSASGTVTQTEISKVLNFVLSMLRSGRRVTSRDIKRYVGNESVAVRIISEAKRKGYLIYDYKLRGYMITDKGLDFLQEDVTVDELYEALRGGGE